MPYNHKYNVSSALLNKTFPSYTQHIGINDVISIFLINDLLIYWFNGWFL